MNIRIEDNFVRFRISHQELVQLNQERRLESVVQIHSEDGRTLEGEFIYALAVEPEFDATRCLIQPSFILFVLHEGDLAILNGQPEEGFVYERESTGPEGQTHYFRACVEVDRLG